MEFIYYMIVTVIFIFLNLWCIYLVNPFKNNGLFANICLYEFNILLMLRFCSLV